MKACSTDTLAMLRLKVFQALSVHPRNQRLYVRGELLEGEDFTLAKVCVAAAATAERLHAPLALPQCSGDLCRLSAGSAAAVLFSLHLLLPVGAT